MWDIVFAEKVCHALTFQQRWLFVVLIFHARTAWLWRKWSCCCDGIHCCSVFCSSHDMSVSDILLWSRPSLMHRALLLRILINCPMSWAILHSLSQISISSRQDVASAFLCVRASTWASDASGHMSFTAATVGKHANGNGPWGPT